MPRRRAALRPKKTGLLLDGEHKSTQPLAAHIVDSDAETEAKRWRLRQSVVVADEDHSPFTNYRADAVAGDQVVSHMIKYY